MIKGWLMAKIRKRQKTKKAFKVVTEEDLLLEGWQYLKTKDNQKVFAKDGKRTYIGL